MVFPGGSEVIATEAGSFSFAQSSLALCDAMNCSKPGFPILNYLPEFAQTHVHWVSDAIQPSHPLSSIPFSCLQSFPASGSFPMSQLFESGGQRIGASASSVLSMNIQGWFPLGLIDLISLLSKGLLSRGRQGEARSDWFNKTVASNWTMD